MYHALEPAARNRKGRVIVAADDKSDPERTPADREPRPRCGAVNGQVHAVRLEAFVSSVHVESIAGTRLESVTGVTKQCGREKD